jgi:hypothetical protein
MTAGVGQPSSEQFAIAASCVGIGPVLFAVSSCVDRCCCREAKEAVVRPTGEKKPRIIYLDVWRTVCVVCVVITHADEIFANWNVACVTQWVLQVIMCTSGMCYGFSRASCKHLLHYVSRIFLLFSVCCGFNWIGNVIGGEDWWTDIPDDIGFQGAFILLIAFAAILCFPLKIALGFGVRGKCMMTVIAVYLISTAAFGALWYYTVIITGDSSNEVMLRAATTTLALLVVAAGSVFALPTKWRGMSGWILLACLYLVQVAAQSPKFGYWCHLVDLYIWAFLVQRVPLLGTASIGAFIAESWLLIFIPSVLFGAFPGHKGRLDKWPLEAPHLRLRHYFLEALFVVTYTTVPSAGVKRTIPMPAWVRPHVPWMSWWSLLVFSFHKGLYLAIQFDSSPWPLAMALGSSFPFAALYFLLTRRQTRGGNGQSLEVDQEKGPVSEPEAVGGIVQADEHTPESRPHVQIHTEPVMNQGPVPELGACIVPAAPSARDAEIDAVLARPSAKDAELDAVLDVVVEERSSKGLRATVSERDGVVIEASKTAPGCCSF